MKVSAVRSRIENARQDLARAQGETEVLEGEIEAALTKLREVLDCRAGQEKRAIEKLKAKIAKTESKVAGLLDEAEEIRGG